MKGQSRRMRGRKGGLRKPHQDCGKPMASYAAAITTGSSSTTSTYIERRRGWDTLQWATTAAAIMHVCTLFVGSRARLRECTYMRVCLTAGEADATDYVWVVNPVLYPNSGLEVPVAPASRGNGAPGTWAANRRPCRCTARAAAGRAAPPTSPLPATGLSVR